ncbi:hypothetical protein OROGR_005911 [Orobanche gracilis]
MGNELRYVCLVETRRLLLLMGVVFGLILFVQYFEVPYTSILSSLFSTGVDNFRNSSTSIKPYDEKNIDATDVKDDFDQENITLNSDMDTKVESPFDDFLKKDRNSTIERIVRNNNNTVPFEGNRENSEYTSETSNLLDHDGIWEVGQITEANKNKTSNPETPSAAKSPSNLSSNFASQESQETSSISENIPQSNGSLARKEDSGGSQPDVVPLSKMNDMLLQSHVSYQATKPQWSSTVDQDLLNARSLIEKAAIVEKDPQVDVNLYRNFSEFKRSYELMEQTLKVYIYTEGEKPIFHQPPLKGIYASEGWFMKLLKSNERFVTKNPKRAHLFYLPFSSRMLEVSLYIPNSHSRNNLIERLSNYVEMITKKYHFWNRTDGADHFLVACHDWAPAETWQIMHNCIRALCNSDIKEGFKFGKDASLPETFVRSPQNPLRQLGGKPPSQRRTLAFFAGSMHGYLRPVLLNYWENKDPDMKIFGQLRKKKGQMSYAQYMKSSRYCICAKGFEVNSPRVVEAIFYECVPVIISDNFVPPFFETLNWESFAVFVLEKDIPNLKSILVSIPKKRYIEMQKRVKEVQKHFLWHSRPVKYDVFHMVLHSVWYNRVFQFRQDLDSR